MSELYEQHTKWFIKLSECAINYDNWLAIKAQVFTNLVIESIIKGENHQNWPKEIEATQVPVSIGP